MKLKQQDFVYRSIVRLGELLVIILRAKIVYEGVEKLPPDYPSRRVKQHYQKPVPGYQAIVAITHSSLLDFVFAQWVIFRTRKTHVRYMVALKWSNNKFMQAINTWCGHITVNRSRGAAAYAEAKEKLQAGEWVGIFPEGTRNRAIRPHRLRTGVVRLAQETGAPIVPVSVFGGQRMLGGGSKFKILDLWKAPVAVVVGAPIEVGSDDDIAEANQKLQQVLSDGIDRAIDIFPADIPAGAPWVPADRGGSAMSVAEAEELWEQKRREREERG